jgi:hypothetical protein
MTPLAAGKVDLTSIQTLIQGLSDSMFTFGAPLAVIGIVIGGASAWLGFQHGPHTLRVSLVALVIVALARVVACGVRKWAIRRLLGGSHG